MRTQRKTTKSYPTIQAWMEATGTNQTELARRVGINQSHLSNILRRSRRASLYVALRLSKLTGVPIEVIAEWPHEYEEAVK